MNENVFIHKVQFVTTDNLIFSTVCNNRQENFEDVAGDHYYHYILYYYAFSILIKSIQQSCIRHQCIQKYKSKKYVQLRA